MKQFDYAIIGQGITGSILATKLVDKGYRIVVFDDFNLSSPSKITSGLINPVTGRKFVKSWKSEELYSIAQSTYESISRLTGHIYFRPTEIHRIMMDKQQEDLWLERTSQPGYDEFLSKELMDTPDYFISKHQIGITRKAARVDITQFLNDSANLLQKADLLVNQKLTQEHIDFSKKQILSTYQFDQLVDCSGAGSFLFNELNRNDYVRPNVGERLLVKFDNYKYDSIVKANHFVIPWSEDLFWVGAHNDWHQTTPTPSDKGLNRLTNFIEKWIDSPYELIDHKAGIRLTTKDRRPLVGTHPQHSFVHFINGLGTKGVSLAPYCVDQLLRFLLEGVALDPEIDIARIY